MAMELLLIREGTKLGASDPVSYDAIQTIKHGEQVTATIRRARNPRHHAKLFALLAAVFPHQKHYATTGDLLTGLKISTGYFDQLQTMEGVPVVIPKSINFVSCSQSEFEQIYERMVDVILNRILPAVNRDELFDQVQEILQGNQP